MKKDKKFLLELEKNLEGIKDKYKKEILSKYENIIKEEKANNKKITSILKEIGPSEDVAKKEIEALGGKGKETFLDVAVKKAKKYNENRKIEKEAKSKLKDEKNANKKLSDKNIKVSVNNKNVKSDKEKEKEKLEKEKAKIKAQKEKEKAKLEKEKEKKRIEKEKEKQRLKEEKAKLKAEKERLEKEKLEKEQEVKEDIVLEEQEVKVEESKFDGFEDINGENKETFKDKLKKAFSKEKFAKIKEFFVKERFGKKERKVEVTPKEVVEEVKEEFTEEVVDVGEIVTEKHLFESKALRRKRIIVRILGVLLTIVVLFLWLWVCVVFIASLIAYLDGVKFIGVIIGLFGLSLLMLWIVVMVNRSIFRKKMSVTLNLIVIVICLIAIALGIVLTIKQISDIKTVKDVSVKYSMTTKMNNYELPEDKSKPFTLTFNSNYKTQYTINYDERIKDKVKVEVKYYECYYDYYIKQTSNSAYISLKLDGRDRLSVYIDDLKEGLIFDNDELSRYTVKITINKKDINRLVIQD